MIWRGSVRAVLQEKRSPVRKKSKTFYSEVWSRPVTPVRNKKKKKHFAFDAASKFRKCIENVPPLLKCAMHVERSERELSWAEFDPKWEQDTFEFNAEMTEGAGLKGKHCFHLLHVKNQQRWLCRRRRRKKIKPPVANLCCSHHHVSLRKPSSMLFMRGLSDLTCSDACQKDDGQLGKQNNRFLPQRMSHEDRRLEESLTRVVESIGALRENDRGCRFNSKTVKWQNQNN